MWEPSVFFIITSPLFTIFRIFANNYQIPIIIQTELPLSLVDMPALKMYY